ncbi:hypothetical protein [Chryseobacterium kwangjuense]|uniref:DUF4783 domain-containing protein n=1 Tax=Chryseobacterium kwangjuense TaxID=267125 RepID=A0A135W893_9FLAO|nr:hypothetical protein [Chryseobacterium kwangjuense]KXH81133.1 hypothetical protein AU378_15535 [Chryseobacterium kwangjuense]
MKKHLLLTIVLCLSCMACGQKSPEKDTQKTNTTQKQKNMDLSKITDETVRNAVQALQDGNQSWYSFFTDNPAMTDDGNTVDFKSFFANALGKEKFLTIDRVGDDGKEIYGNFQAGKWGTFPVFFRFHKNNEGKFDRLDIGQAK